MMCFLTAHRSAARITASRCLSGEPRREVNLQDESRNAVPVYLPLDPHLEP